MLHYGKTSWSLRVEIQFFVTDLQTISEKKEIKIIEVTSNG